MSLCVYISARPNNNISGPIGTGENKWRILSNAELCRLINGADITRYIKAQKAQMGRPHKKNRLLRDGKENIRMETDGEPTDSKTQHEMAG
jgi:hypothetical protein